MTHYTDHTRDDVAERDVVYTERPVVTTTADPGLPPPAVVDSHRPSRVPAFLAGFVTALVVAAVALAVFLVVSDSDDDGNVDVDVPAVQVEDDGG